MIDLLDADEVVEISKRIFEAIPDGTTVQTALLALCRTYTVSCIMAGWTEERTVGVIQIAVDTYAQPALQDVLKGEN